MGLPDWRKYLDTHVDTGSAARLKLQDCIKTTGFASLVSLQVWRIPSPRGRAREGANLLVDNILHVDTIGGF